MNIKFLNQPKDINFIDILNDKISSGKFSKVWIVAGFTKDSALDLIYDAVSKGIENGVSIECVFGVDKKNTSKDMLSKFLGLGCKIRYHINADENKFESRMFIFESDDDKSYVYVPGSKLSEGGITHNFTIIEEIEYDKSEKLEFSKVKAALESGLANDQFAELDEEKLKELASTGEIVARITERKIPSISQLYNGSEEKQDAVVTYDENSSTDYKNLVNKDIDISIESEETIKVQDSLGDEVEHKIKSKEPESEEKGITKMVAPEKEPEFDNITTLIMELSNLSSDEIRIPSAITSSLTKFFNYPDFFHMEKDEKDNLRETQDILLQLFVNKDNTEVTDDNAKIIFTAKTTSIKSDLLKDADIQDSDIMRLIKTDASKYRCEIIKKDTNEYEIWQNFCTIQIKGTSKKIGVL